MNDSSPTAPGDGANVSVFVAVAPAVAFEVFTAEIDLWWRRGPAYRIAGRQRGMLHCEPQVGGRLFESFERILFALTQLVEALAQGVVVRRPTTLPLTAAKEEALRALLAYLDVHRIRGKERGRPR
jgi:hypothetical protein